MKTKEQATFKTEREALAFSEKEGREFNATGYNKGSMWKRIVRNEVEYNKDGTFTVTIEIEN